MMRHHLSHMLTGNFPVLTFILILLVTATGLAWFYVKPHHEAKNRLQVTVQLSGLNQGRLASVQYVKGIFYV
jgi:hypothetical protein